MILQWRFLISLKEFSTKKNLQSYFEDMRKNIEVVIHTNVTYKLSLGVNFYKHVT